MAATEHLEFGAPFRRLHHLKNSIFALKIDDAKRASLSRQEKVAIVIATADAKGTMITLRAPRIK